MRAKQSKIPETNKINMYSKFTYCLLKDVLIHKRADIFKKLYTKHTYGRGMWYRLCHDKMCIPRFSYFFLFFFLCSCPSIHWSDGHPVPVFSLRFKCPDCFFWNCSYIVNPSKMKGSLRDKCLRYSYLWLAFLMAGCVEGICRAPVLGLVLIAGTAIKHAPSVGPHHFLRHHHFSIYY